MRVDGLRFGWPTTRLIMTGVFAIGPFLIIPGLLDPGSVGRSTVVALGLYTVIAAVAVWFMPPYPLWLACVPLLMIPPISAGIIAGASTATLRAMIFPLVVAAVLLRPRLALATFVAVPVFVAFHLAGTPDEDVTEGIIDLVGNLGVAMLVGIGADQVARRGEADALRADIAGSASSADLSAALERHLLARDVVTAALLMVDADPPTLGWFAADVGAGATMMDATVRIAPESRLARAAIVGATAFTDDDTPEGRLLAARGCRSGVVVPLRSSDGLIALLVLGATGERSFRRRRLRAAERAQPALAEAIGTLLLRLEHLEIARLALSGREFAQRVVAAADVASLWDAVLGGLCGLFGADHGWVVARDEGDPSVLVAAATFGLVPADTRIDTTRETSIVHGVLANGEPLWVPDVPGYATVNRRFTDAVPVEAALFLPLSNASETRGVAVLLFAAPRLLGITSVQAAASLAAEGALALSRIEAEDRLRAQATRDPLTGLLNHAAFHAELGAVLRASRRRQPVALVLCDLDHLKFVNDACGHSVGDQALRDLAAVLRSCARRGDVVARLGGDEFGWLLPGASPDDALAAAERAVALASETQVPGAGALSVSAGVAVAVGPSDPAGLFDRADGALYEAKSRGRGMAVAGSADPTRPAAVDAVGEGLGSLVAGTLDEAARHAVREWSVLFRVSGASLSLVHGEMLRELAHASELRARMDLMEDCAIAEFPLTERALTERRTFQVRIDDPDADPAEVAMLRAYEWQAVLLVPLLAPGRAVALLELFEARPRSFTAEEQRLALALGQYLAATLARLVQTG